jgi:hypothetical protein
MASHPRVAAFLCHADDDIAVTSDTHSDFLAPASDVDTVRRGRSGSYPKFARGSGPSGHDNKGAVPDRACVGYNFLMTDPEAQIVSILRNDPLRWHILELVRSIELPDCWIGAGFVRNAIWDHLHDRAPSPLTGDVDVIWYDPDRTDPGLDRACEDALRTVEPAIAWSVKTKPECMSVMQTRSIGQRLTRCDTGRKQQPLSRPVDTGSGV